MKKLNIILIIIAIINIILAFSNFSKEGYVIKVNSKNKVIVQQALNNKIGNTDNITKVILGNGWQSGRLTIYHFWGKTDTVHITEGVFELGELEDYIRSNGESLDTRGCILLGISGIIGLYISVYTVINKKRIS